MNNKLRFALNFLRHPIRNASVIPSSVSACKAMVSGIDFSKINTVVELGPGTGVFTAEILKRCRTGTKIILVELEPTYVTLLRKKFGDRVIVEQASAHMFAALAAKHTEQPIGLIISGLPFSLPHGTKEKLFASIKEYTDRGVIYRFFTYNPPLMKRVYKSLPIRKISFVFRNFPPLWVYGIN
ncbi:MAG: rRNA adenine N-6-methyltransferase family protein [bacterium]|nr:rRNA adenine N-6-methyltransferase family protein [bacterium]